ncbi:MAG: uracil-DNA glycosylase [Patescibacteria group bacterium]|nr:uracil-DNA glycosylase [Patescibacteria group bacterium]
MPKTTDINSAETLSDIERQITNCKKCPLYKTKTKDVPGAGDEEAEIFFIGEAPGKAEDLSGEPFVGAAGKLLTEMIETIGLTRSDVFIANVLKHRPPENRDPLPDEVEACWPYLSRQIEIVGPKLIIFLGRHALNRFFPLAKISEVHGRAFKKKWNGKEQVFLALYHPAAALYNGSMKETLMKDFKKIPKLIEKIIENNNLKQEKLI